MFSIVLNKFLTIKKWQKLLALRLVSKEKSSLFKDLVMLDIGPQNSLLNKELN